jgi:copper(I)-binding protein
VSARAARAPDRPRKARRLQAVVAIARAAAIVVLAAHALAGACAGAAVTFRDGWMRPADRGDATAEAYVDVTAGAALTIVGARTAIAERVDLVAPAKGSAQPWRIAPGTTLRFARKGNVLALARIVEPAATGDTVEIVFTFEDAGGRRFDAAAPILVRGVRPPAR